MGFECLCVWVSSWICVILGLKRSTRGFLGVTPVKEKRSTFLHLLSLDLIHIYLFVLTNQFVDQSSIKRYELHHL